MTYQEATAKVKETLQMGNRLDKDGNWVSAKRVLFHNVSNVAPKSARKATLYMWISRISSFMSPYCLICVELPI